MGYMLWGIGYGDICGYMCWYVCVLQNVLGRYSDYQSAMRKMNMNEQMYGVAEPTPSLKARTSHLTQPPNPNQKKEKFRKKQHKDCKLGGDGDQPVTEYVERKKKASVQPYHTVSSASASGTSHSSLLVKHITPPSEDALSKLSGTSTLPTSVQHSTTEQVSSKSTQFVGSKGKVKVKKQKKRKNGDMESESVSIPNRPPPAKPRPEALSLPETESTPIQSDVPDTGDVRYMLQELLHPTPVSLVTPIPTPNTVKPFIFPPVRLCLCSYNSVEPPNVPLQHVFKTPNTYDIITSTASCHIPSDANSNDLHMQHKVSY